MSLNKCWRYQTNKNTRIYDMDTNKWTTSTQERVKSRFQGLVVGCAGLIWNFGGNPGSPNKGTGILAEMWTWTGDPDDPWDTTSHENIPNYSACTGLTPRKLQDSYETCGP